MTHVFKHPGVRWGVLIFVGALALRLLYLQQPQTPSGFWDARAYYEAGRSLSAGKLSPGAWTIIVSRGPAYPAFLAVIFTLGGDNPWTARYVQAVLGAATCVLVYLLGTRVSNRTAGVVAAICTAICPGLILQTGHIHTETLATFLLWGGILLTMIGTARNAWRVISLAGAVSACACLTRPTLLPTIPFLIVAVWLSARCDTWRKRAWLTGVFAALLLVPLATWSLYAALKGGSPTAGAAGLKTMLNVFELATHPSLRGWNPASSQYQGTEGMLADRLYRVPASLNLIFCHLWYADNVWRQSFIFSPAGMDGLQRLLSLSGLAGVGIAWLRRRKTAPILAVLAGYAVTAVKFIELRPLLPFLPALFLLGGLGVSALLHHVRRADCERRSALRILGCAALLTAVALFALEPFTVQCLLPFLAPRCAAWLCDAFILVLAVLWGAIASRVLRGGLGPAQARIASLAPAVLFVVLFGAYACIGSLPRWQSFSLDLLQLPATVTQQIHLPAPLPPEMIESAQWLVDLQSDKDAPPLDVALDGVCQPPETVRWIAVPFEPAEHQDVCETLAAFSGHRLSQYPRWWAVSMEPAQLANRDIISCSLKIRQGVTAATLESQIRLGGVFSSRAGGQFRGPSLKPGLNSIYRWEVAEDLRLWESTRLASCFTWSSVSPAGSVSAGRHSWLMEQINQQRAQLNIRLLIRLRDGRHLIY